MKKSLFLMAAASALMLTACTSEDEVLQSSAPQKAEAKAVGFDVYLPQAVTRAGDAGVMTTQALKDGQGFGVFAMYQNDANYASTSAPNFMFNEQVHWSGGWTYSPLKYWPNETIKDSQTPNNATTPGTYTDADHYTCDKVSFFAYAPYVNLTVGTGKMETNVSESSKVDAYVSDPAQTSGILSYTKEDRANDPLVEWGYTTNLDNNVDLLWGVAPNGMSYQSVNPDVYVNKRFGYPLTDMVKPNKDQNIKFLFQHALSRIGLSVVSAIDQIAAGDDGGVFNKEQTRVLIKSVEVYGDFGKQGVLNLKNANQNEANWIPTSIAKSGDTDATPLFYFDNNTKYKTGDEIAINGYIAPDLRYVEDQITAVGTNPDNFAKINAGVLPSEQVIIAGDKDPSKEVSAPEFTVGKVYYKANTAPDNGYSVATTSATTAVNAYMLTGEYNTAGSFFTQVFKTDGSTKATVSGLTDQLYTLTISDEKTNAGGDALAENAPYYTRTGTDGAYVYTYHKATGSEAATLKYYIISDKANLSVSNYTGTLYTGLIPRYFMVIPTGPTDIQVKIKYAVVTKDEKLTGKVSNIENYITKKINVDLKSGKSYNLKLILGLTSVKLDASVADWQVADDAEVYLPQNKD